MSEVIEWKPDQMLEVKIKEPDDFLKIRETLTRIGVASRKERKIYQSCHILHKQGRYFIVHFKELLVKLQTQHLYHRLKYYHLKKRTNGY